MSNELWTEKHRPKTFDCIKGQSSVMEQIKEKVKQGELTHLILKGPQGTGKTTTSKVIARVLYVDEGEMINFKEMNAGDKRKLEDIRKIVGDFMRYKPWGKSRFKLLVLDKAESITKDSQEALERMMEEWGNNCRVIMCVNDIERIEPTIRSRCTEYQFQPLTEKDIHERLREIAIEQKIQISDADVAKIANRARGDLRKAINNMQMGNYPKDEAEALFN
jgi:DNA polymerase III delta prime subunit